MRNSKVGNTEVSKEAVNAIAEHLLNNDMRLDKQAIKTINDGKLSVEQERKLAQFIFKPDNGLFQFGPAYHRVVFKNIRLAVLSQEELMAFYKIVEAKEVQEKQAMKWILLFVIALGIVMSVINFINPGEGIHETAGFAAIFTVIMASGILIFHHFQSSRRSFLKEVEQSYPDLLDNFKNKT